MQPARFYLWQSHRLFNLPSLIINTMSRNTPYNPAPFCRWLMCLLVLAILPLVVAGASPRFELKLKQLTFGEKHHFFGYIGQCQTIPWNASGRYVLGMEIERIDRMPLPEDAATIFVVDTHDHDKIIRLDKTHAWNPQQGTMFYWNPLAPETQFFFNDRDIKTGEVFTVIYDIEKKRRVRE